MIYEPITTTAGINKLCVCILKKTVARVPSCSIYPVVLPRYCTSGGTKVKGAAQCKQSGKSPIRARPFRNLSAQVIVYRRRDRQVYLWVCIPRGTMRVIPPTATSFRPVRDLRRKIMTVPKHNPDVSFRANVRLLLLLLVYSYFLAVWRGSPRDRVYGLMACV